MVIRKNRNIIIIPFSLLVVAILSIFGPWSSFSISYVNQKERLLSLLNSNHLIQNGKVVTAKHPLPHKVRVDISSITNYLYDYGKLQNLSDLIPSRKSITPESFVEEIGFKYVERWDYERKSFYYRCFNKSFAFPTKKYQLFVTFRDDFNVRDSKTRRIKSGDIAMEFFPETATFQFSRGKSQKSQIKLEQIAEYFRTTGNKNNDDCCNYHFEDEFFEINCLFDNLYGWEDENGLHFNSVTVDFFIRKK
jgi:hypothetical protein